MGFQQEKSLIKHQYTSPSHSLMLKRTTCSRSWLDISLRGLHTFFIPCLLIHSYPETIDLCNNFEVRRLLQHLMTFHAIFWKLKQIESAQNPRLLATTKRKNIVDNALNHIVLIANCVPKLQC